VVAPSRSRHERKKNRPRFAELSPIQFGVRGRSIGFIAHIRKPIHPTRGGKLRTCRSGVGFHDGKQGEFALRLRANTSAQLLTIVGLERISGNSVVGGTCRALVPRVREDRPPCVAQPAAHGSLSPRFAHQESPKEFAHKFALAHL
jgi:hypothetical protein